MVASYFSRLTAFLHVFAFVGNAVCTPVRLTEFNGLDNKARGCLERSKKVPALSTNIPRFVIYSDKDTKTTGPPPVAQVKGPNVLQKNCKCPWAHRLPSLSKLFLPVQSHFSC